MALTPLPVPRITAPNWGAQLNNAITSRYTDLLNRILGNSTDITDLQEFVNVSLPSEVMEGRTIYQWGNSRGVGVTAKRVSFNRILDRVGSGFWFNGSVAGYLATDAVSFALGSFTASRQGNGINEWAPTANIGTSLTIPNSAAVCLLWPYANDARLDGRADRNSTTAKARASAINALHAMVCLQRAEVRIDSGAITIATTNGSPNVSTPSTNWPWYRGMLIVGPNVPANTYVGDPINAGLSGFKLSSSRTTQVDVNATATASAAHAFTPVETGVWTAFTNTSFSAGGMRSTVANGATATWVITLPEERRVHLLTAGVDDAEYVATSGAPFGGTGGAAWSITVDAGPPITGSNSNQHRFGAKDFGWGPRAIDLGSLAAGSHTIVATTTSANLFVADTLLVETLTPLTTVIMQDPVLSSAAYALYTSTGYTEAKTDLYNGFIEDEVALWPSDDSVLTLNPDDAGFDPDLHISWADDAGIHFNDAGERLVADQIMTVLNALPAREGLVWV